MSAKIISSIITISMMVYLILLIMFFFLQEDVKEAVNELNYSMAESVSTTGMMGAGGLRYLKEGLSRYGDYRITLKLERKIGQDLYDTFYDSDIVLDEALETGDFTGTRVINQQLRIGDRVTILAEDANPTTFARLMGFPIFGLAPSVEGDMRIRSMKTATVGGF